jgi:hypothetical protein
MRCIDEELRDLAGGDDATMKKQPHSYCLRSSKYQNSANKEGEEDKTKWRSTLVTIVLTLKQAT